tara:strand:+ start:183 stop:377 length:195 start_codon:yes stop_codon:yes gene_type:complete
MQNVAIIGGDLIGFIIVGVLVFWSNIGSINKTAVEEASSEATKAKVTLNEVYILADGKGAIRGF